MSAPALRPLGVGEILDVGIKIYWRNAWTLFRIVIFVVLPAQILVGLVQISSVPPDTRVTEGFGFGPSFQTTDTDLSTSEAVTFGAGFVVALLIGALAGKLAQAGCFRAVADAYLGEDAGWRPSLRYALRRLPAVVAVSILATLFVGLGLIACIVPGIYLWGAFYVAIPVVLVEGVGPIRALGRSRQLVQGRWWGTIGVALVGTILVSVVTAVLTALFLGLAFANPAKNTVTGFVVSTLSTTLASTVTTPAVAAFATVLYIDLRVRKEGFDLLLLARRLGVEPRDPGAGAGLLPPALQLPQEGSEQPPYWPPPPGWRPSSQGPAAPAPESTPDQPPYWPPPPGWTPGPPEPPEPETPPFWPERPGGNPRRE